nr:hypothetical protein CFP56_28641 [Quercus suber]
MQALEYLVVLRALKRDNMDVLVSPALGEAEASKAFDSHDSLHVLSLDTTRFHARQDARHAVQGVEM